MARDKSFSRPMQRLARHQWLLRFTVAASVRQPEKARLRAPSGEDDWAEKDCISFVCPEAGLRKDLNQGPLVSIASAIGANAPRGGVPDA